MSDEFNINEFSAIWADLQVDRVMAWGKAFDKITGNAKRKLKKSYATYQTTVYEKYKNSKSFLIKTEPVPLYDYYVPATLSQNKNEIKDANIKDILAQGKYCVITGHAGSGKSMLMRHFLLNALKSDIGVPVFIELRRINGTDDTIENLIIETLDEHGFQDLDEYIHQGIREGHFCFFFDGYDEVAQDKRPDVSKYIRKLSKAINSNSVIISSRPDDKFQDWDNYSVYEIEPLTLEKACELVEKLPLVGDIKPIFIQDLKNKLFKLHESFLSNPLLLSIMLLTYRENAEIPNKISLFYEQAYQALFSQHDAYKGGYKRESNSGLDISDMRKVFAAFCLVSYDQRKFQFNESEAIGYLQKSSSMTGIKLNPSEVLMDLRQGICLLIDDGLYLTFSHRSFQEYFVAEFIARSTEVTKNKLVKKYCRDVESDNVMLLLFELDRDIVESGYILPELNYLANKIQLKVKIGMMAYTRYLKLLGSQYAIFNFQDSPTFGIIGAEFGDPTDRIFQLLSYIDRVYPDTSGAEQITDYYENLKLSKAFSDFDSHSEIHFNMAKLSYKSEIVKYMAEYGGWLSRERIQNIMDLRWEIERLRKDKSDALSDFF